MSALIFPTVHLNGTSAKQLTEGLGEAYEAVDKAMDKLRDAAPNARDYYVQGDRAFQKAVEQHEARAKKLQAVADELMAIYESVEDQASAR